MPSLLIHFPMSYLAHPDSESCDLRVYGKPSESRMCHVNEEAIGGHHVDKNLTCLLWLHDKFSDFSSISLIFAQWLA